MNVALAAAQKQFVDDQVRSGQYVDASEVVRTAVRLMQVRHATATTGWVAEGDIAAIASFVTVEAAKSAQEDLKAVMAEMKAINSAKQGMRELLYKVQRDCAANAGRRDGEPLDFSRGLGSERTYHRVPVPCLDPDAPGGVRPVPTDLHPGRVQRKEELCAIKERVKSDLDTMSEMGEMESLRLQIAMDRYSRLMSALSNVLEKMSDTAAGITQNLK